MTLNSMMVLYCLTVCTARGPLLSRISLITASGLILGSRLSSSEAKVKALEASNVDLYRRGLSVAEMHDYHANRTDE